MPNESSDAGTGAAPVTGAGSRYRYALDSRNRLESSTELAALDGEAAVVNRAVDAVLAAPRRLLRAARGRLRPPAARPTHAPVHEVAVGRYASGTEAAMWAEVLAGEGIPSVAAAMGPGTAYLGASAVPHELRVRAA